MRHIQLSLVALAFAGPAVAGVVVERVVVGGLGHELGIAIGETFTHWQMLDASRKPVDEGEIDDPFDFAYVRLEIAPRGTVRLLGPDPSSARELVWEEWGLEVRPDLGPEDLADYERGRAPGPIEAWYETAAALDRLEDRAWLYARIADRRASEARNPLDAASEIDRLYALAVTTVGASDVARAQLHRRWAERIRDRSEWDAAGEKLRVADELDQARDPGGIAVARDALDLAALEARRSNLRAAEDQYRRAIEILRVRARPGPLLAEALGAFSFLLNVSGRMDEAEALGDEAEAIVEASGLEGRVARVVLNSLGALRLRRGDYARSIPYFDRIVAISERMERRDRMLANALHNRGISLRRLGDVEGAERSIRRSLAVREELDPDGLHVAQSYEMLGNILSTRRDLPGAEALYRRAVEIYDRLSPDGFSVGSALVNLGATVANQERLDEAEAHYRRAVEVLERQAPESWIYSVALRNLAALHQDRDELDQAEPYLRRALALMQKLAPGSVDEAGFLSQLGLIASQRGDDATALELFERAHALHARVAPGTREAAESLFQVGRTQERLGDDDKANACFCDAIDALDMQRARLGGTEETYVRFGADYRKFAERCVEGLIALDRPAKALAVLERTRAPAAHLDPQLFARVEQAGARQHAVAALERAHDRSPGCAAASATELERDDRRAGLRTPGGQQRQAGGHQAGEGQSASHPADLTSRLRRNARLAR